MARRKIVALMINDAGLGDDYQGGLRRGVEQSCLERDIDLWVYAGRTDWTPSGMAQRQVYELVDPSRIDGIVVAAGCIASHAPLEQVLGGIRRRCPVPLCAVGQCCPGVPSILVDNVSGAARMVDHLVRDHGCRRLAYVAGPPEHEESEQRLRGTRDALGRHGLDLDPAAIGHGDFLAHTGREVVAEFLRRRTPFDAIITANDDMAVGALEVLRACGIGCPEQVAVAGFDDAAQGRFSQPALTTIRQPVARLGAAAVARLVQMWEGHGVPSCLELDTELVIRESCGCHPAASSRMFGAPSELIELVALLTPLFDDPAERRHWSEELAHAVRAECVGEPGALLAAFEGLVGRLPHPHVPIHDLQRVIGVLRRHAEARAGCPPPEDAFHAARVLVSGHASRRTKQQQLRNKYLLDELRVNWERLGTSLTLPSLKHALTAELPRLGIHDALISLHSPDAPQRLVPFLCLENGVPVNRPEQEYPAELLLPPGALEARERRSLTVLPLTFESEQLGVAVLNLSPGLEVYTLLREQIGSAVKTVYLHQDVLRQERLQAQTQEEKRATAERLRSVSLIAGGVAHDLNNVLGPLIALPETIQHDLVAGAVGAVPPIVLEDLDTIRQAGQRAAHMIRDLLALGRPDGMPQTTLDLRRLLAAEHRTFTGLCASEPRIAVFVDPGSIPLVVRSSKPQLVRAVSNLIINAVDAIHERGTITIRALLHTVDQCLEGIECIEPGHYAVIEVQDSGCGIPEAELPRVLEPFFTAKRRAGSTGTGLGLAIVHRIAKDSKGYVRVQSRVGEGSKFSLYLPLEEDLECPQSMRAPAAVGGQERILVVDDEPLQLRTARRILEHLGYLVTTAESGQEALAIVAATNDHSAFDLVIVDMVMAGEFAGMALLEQIRRLHPSQKILLTSGHAPDQVPHSELDGDPPWLAKPYTTGALAAAVRAVLDAPPWVTGVRKVAARRSSEKPPGGALPA
jgi:DNA-binding LacI/PurR family transcriptional regulator/signal transduction histidine kinase/ActR/RegA family two-component response regulator